MKKIFTFIIVGIIFIMPINTLALINNNNVEMTQEQYDNLVSIFGKATVDNMSQKIFDIEKNNVYEEISSKTVYVMTQYITGLNGEILGVEEQNITKEEYESSQSSDNGISLLGPSWETTYKKLNIKQFGANPGSDGGYSALKFVMTNEWKIMPKVRSYDIMAFRYYHFTPIAGTAWGQMQYSESDGVIRTTNYDSNSSGYNAPYGESVGGFGISMKLPVGEKVTYIQSQLTITGTGDNLRDYGMYGTYQHASKTINSAASTQYTISESGLGSVIKFKDSATNSYYDNMQGVSDGGAFFPG